MLGEMNVTGENSNRPFVPSKGTLIAQLCFFLLTCLFSWECVGDLCGNSTSISIGTWLGAIIPPLLTIITILAFFRFRWIPTLAVFGQIAITVLVACSMVILLNMPGEVGFGAIALAPFELISIIISVIHLIAFSRYRRQLKPQSFSEA